MWKPTTKFGVIDSDRKYVVIITLISFTIPFFLDLSVFRIPLPLPMALLGLAFSIIFFKFIRLGRRPLWFKNRIWSLCEDIKYRSRRVRRSLARDEERRGNGRWIADASGSELLSFLSTGQTSEY